MKNRYTIGQVSQLIDRSIATIRRWEQRGWIPAPHRRDPITNNRIYTDADVACIIKVRDEGPDRPLLPTHIQA